MAAPGQPGRPRQHDIRRPDLATIPLTDVEPGHVVLATREGEHDRLLTEFGRYARDHLTGTAR